MTRARGEPRGPVHVVAGVVSDDAGRFLIAERPPGRPMPGRWELPGGKLHRGESQRAALQRELREELGIEVHSARPLIEVRHCYPDRAVVLHTWQVRRYTGSPSGREGQQLRWVDADELLEVDLLEADRPIITAMRLPERYLITGEPLGEADVAARLERALAGGVRLVQLRAPGASPATLGRLARVAAARCRERGARLLVNGQPEVAAAIARDVGAHGVHVPARFLRGLQGRPVEAPMLFAASCHDRQELTEAAAAGADFCVLGPVCATPSHSGGSPLGWAGFRRLVRRASMPVFALGGMTAADLEQAWRAGAQGIAAIRALWGPDGS